MPRLLCHTPLIITIDPFPALSYVRLLIVAYEFTLQTEGSVTGANCDTIGQPSCTFNVTEEDCNHVNSTGRSAFS